MGRESRAKEEQVGQFNVLVTVTYLDDESIDYECHSWRDTPTTLALEFFNRNLRIIPHTSIKHFDIAPLNKEEKSVIVQ